MNGTTGAQATYAFSTGQWYHIAVSRQGSTVRMFVDGQLIASNTNTQTVVLDSNPFYICKQTPNRASPPNHYTNCYMDDFRFTKGIARYTDNFTPPAALPTYLTKVYNLAQNGLVMQLDAGDSASYNGTGTTWSDLKGSTDVTLLNGPVFTGASFTFDGTNDIADSATNVLQHDYISIGVRFRTTDTENIVPILDFNTTSNDSGINLVFNTGDNRISMLWRDQSWVSGGYPKITGTSNVRDGQWHHVVAVLSESEVILYVDGVPEARQTITAPLYHNTAQYLRIGGLGNQASAYRLAMEVTDVYAYSRALTQIEIAKNNIAL